MLRELAPRPAPASRTSTERTASGADGSRWTPLAAVLALLPVAAVTELVLMRTFYRVGIYIPKVGAFRAVYRILTALGSFALNLSSVLVLVALVLLAASAARAGRRTEAFALGAFVAATLVVAASRSPEVGPTSRIAFVLAVIVCAWPFIRARGEPWGRVAAAAVAASVLLSSYSGFEGDASRLAGSGVEFRGAIGAQLAGEALVVASAVALFVAWVASDGWRIRPLALAVAPLLGFLIAWRAAGAATGILVLWTAGLRLYLPLWLYGLALWAFLAAAIGWLPSRPWRTGGLALLLAAGLLLETTYQQSLALVAVILLTDGAAIGGLPAVRREVSADGRGDRLSAPLNVH